MFALEGRREEDHHDDSVESPRDETSPQDLLVLLFPELSQERADELCRVDLVVCGVRKFVHEVDEMFAICKQPGQIKHAYLYLRLSPVSPIVTVRLQLILYLVVDLLLCNQTAPLTYGEDCFHLGMPCRVHDSLCEGSADETFTDELDRVG